MHLSVWGIKPKQTKKKIFLLNTALSSLRLLLKRMQILKRYESIQYSFNELLERLFKREKEKEKKSYVKYDKQ